MFNNFILYKLDIEEQVYNNNYRIHFIYLAPFWTLKVALQKVQ